MAHKNVPKVTPASAEMKPYKGSLRDEVKPERQVMLMKDFGVTAVGGTPSYFIRIIDVAEKMGVDIRSLNVKRGIFGAEPWSDGMRDYIEEKTGIKAYDIYGLSEIVGPGVGCECECRDGIHIFEAL